LLFAFSLLFAIPIYAETFAGVCVAGLYDGDTFRVNLPCDYDVLCKNVPVRVAGVDTPEIKTKDKCEKRAAQKAKQFTRAFLGKPPVSLLNCRRDKYFRLLCDVKNSEGESLADNLLKAGFAVPYNGKEKPKINWCDKIEPDKNNK
jgi:endonuclease YncB( thermonuclease family)